MGGIVGPKGASYPAGSSSSSLDAGIMTPLGCTMQMIHSGSTLTSQVRQKIYDKKGRLQREEVETREERTGPVAVMRCEGDTPHNKEQAHHLHCQQQCIVISLTGHDRQRTL